MLVSKMYQLLLFKNHLGKNVSKPIFKQYNQYKPVLN